MSWLNKNTGIVHAHALLGTGHSPNQTACHRVVLWERGIGKLRDDFEQHDRKPGDRLCKSCVIEVEYQLAWRQDWLDGGVG